MVVSPKKGNLPKDYILYLGAGAIFHISKTKPVLRNSSKQRATTNKQNTIATFLAAPWGATYKFSFLSQHTATVPDIHSLTQYRVKALMLRQGSIS